MADREDTEFIQDGERLLWWYDFYLPIFEYLFTEIGDLHGKRILEIGCGTGGTAVLLARRGACVLGIDLLPSRLAEAEERAKCYGVAETVQFALMDVTQLAFGDNIFDYVISKSVLVLTDHVRTAQECYRVLKPKGKAIFVENMRNHPLIWLYRKLRLKYAANVRYFSMAEIKQVGQHFDRMQHREFHLLSIASLIWRNLVSVPILYRFTLRQLTALDERLLRWFPSLKQFCWITVMSCDKT